MHLRAGRSAARCSLLTDRRPQRGTQVAPFQALTAPPASRALGRVDGCVDGPGLSQGNKWGLGAAEATSGLFLVWKQTWLKYL